MRLVLHALVASGLAIACFALAQSSAPAQKPVPWKRYCQSESGFCFRYPSSWTMLGEVFEGTGVVVAPPQKAERALWDEITTALVAPAPEGDEEGPGLNGIVEQAMSGLREAGQNFVTLQRQERTVDRQPAQMLKVQYREKSSGRDWVEELVFIEGPENEIYSVALKCAPQHLARLEPVLKRVLESWTLPEGEPAAEVGDENQPVQPPPPAKTTQPPH